MSSTSTSSGKDGDKGTGKKGTRGQILEAAKKRFSHFGYAKTTMAEVAADCAMSPGNLYRFFEGKLDIAQAIALEGETSRREEMERLACEPRAARARLFDFFFRELRSTYRKLAEDPRTAEITRLVARERPTFSESILGAERALIARILQDGGSCGEFAIHDAAHTAEMIQSATLKFRFPQLWSAEPLSQLERELEGVLKLIIEGISRRERADA
jgi:AcrR family transcriptional regulator